MATEANKQPPFKPPTLPSSELQPLISKCELIAIQNGFLITYEPKPQTITDNNMKYMICLAENLSNKPTNNMNKNKTKNSKPFDPFSGPFITGSHICDLGDKNEYRLILNKFPVLPKHILIISSNWIQQTNLLTINDFDMTLKVFKSILINKQNKNPLIFINSGILSGATQMHRHLHIIPNTIDTLLINQIAKSFKDNNESDEKKEINIDTNIKMYENYKFLHGIILLDCIDNINCNKLNKYYNKLIKWIKNKMKNNNKINNEYLSENKFCYNLLITEYVMMIVVRKCGVFEGNVMQENEMEENEGVKVQFSINALPFAGLIFCNSINQMKLVNKVGINTMIKQCTFALE